MECCQASLLTKELSVQENYKALVCIVNEGLIFHILTMPLEFRHVAGTRHLC